VIIQTLRFGNVRYKEEDVLNFIDPLLGFSSLKNFILIDDESDGIFLWMQSIENPDIAFPLLEPQIFKVNYSFKMSSFDKEQLKVEKIDELKLFAIITIPDDITQITANLKAPVAMNLKERIAKQLILQEADYTVRHEIFAELKQYLASTKPKKDGDSSKDDALQLKTIFIQNQKEERPEITV
jgi:flagellar assembly factor FliW